MTRDEFKVNPIFSLKFQLCAGAIGLLALTLGSVSYLLIEHQKRILKNDLQRTIVLQGRNVALGSAKALFRSDPEFELLPLVTRISESSEEITSLVITDSDKTIQADMELQNIGQPYRPELLETQYSQTDLLERHEELRENHDLFFLRTPVTSLDKTIGYVYMSYSKQELIRSMHGAVRITLICGAAAFVLGIILSLMIFRRISYPMDVVVEGVNSLGQGNLDARIELTTRNEFRFLARSFNSMATALLDVQSELVAKELVDRELEIAHDIQSTLIPEHIRQPRGYEIAVYYQSAMQVGGDYVDVIPIGPNRIAVVMADVSGKGIPGLVVTAMLKIMVHDLVTKGMEPRTIVRKLNESLAVNVRKNMFVTLFLGILDLSSRELIYSNAGHNPVLVYNAAEARCEFKRITGRPLALFSDELFCERLSEGVVQLDSKGLFLIYTDGLNESRNKQGKQFGHDRIAGICKQFGASGAQRVVDKLLRAEQRFRGDRPQSDDLTLLAVRATGSVVSQVETNEMVRAK